MKNSIFQFIDIFNIKNGFYNKKPTESFQYTPIPFIGATAFNNGMTDNYNIQTISNSSKTGDKNNTELENKLFAGNCITVTNNGSVGYAYYQPSTFTCSHDVNPLFLLTDDLNKNNALYLVTSIEKQRVCFEYARKWRPKRMRKSKILLPVNSKGKPDYDYMESYIKDLKEKKEKEYFEYIYKRFEILKDIQKPLNLEDKKWEEFKITDVFQDIKRGRRLKKDDHIKGNVPYVSSTALNNGVDEFIGNNTNVSVFENCLTLANSGSVGATYYQPFKVIASDHVTKLENKEYSRYIYLFIAVLIERIGVKYGFNREINDRRLKKEKLLLPTNDYDKPDYQYMEQYMKYIEYKKLYTYLKFKKLI